MNRAITAEDLGLTMEKKEKPLFKWFLASYLFGKRIHQEAAQKTWEIFMKQGIDSTKKIADHSWQQLVKLLDAGSYTRYDESMARNLLDVAHTLLRDYHGQITKLRDSCTDEKEFMKQLQRLKGVGPKTTEIFMREARPVLFT